MANECPSCRRPVPEGHRSCPACRPSPVFTKVIMPDEKDPVGAILKALDSIAALKKAVQAESFGSDPSSALALAGEAVAFNEQGRYQEALDKLAQVEAFGVDTSEHHACKGLNLRGLERHEDALRSFQRAVQLDPANANAWFYIAESLNRLGRPDRALSAYDRVVELAPQDAEAWAERAMTLEANGRPLDAVESFDRASKADPDWALAGFYQGRALAGLGRDAEAATALERFLAAASAQKAEHLDEARRLLEESRRRSRGGAP